MTTRHYQHPGQQVTHPGVTITTVYGSGKPFLRAEGPQDALDTMQARFNLKRADPLSERTS